MKISWLLMLCVIAAAQKKIVGIQGSIHAGSLVSSFSDAPVFYYKNPGFGLGYTRDLTSNSFFKNRVGAGVAYNPIVEQFSSGTKVLESKIQLMQLKLYHQPLVLGAAKGAKPYVSFGYYVSTRLTNAVSYRVNGGNWLKDGTLYRDSDFFTFTENKPLDVGIKGSAGIHIGHMPLELSLERGLIKTYPGHYLSMVSLSFTL